MSPSGPSTPFKNLALAAATTLIFGGLIEGAARLLEPPPVQREEYLWDWSERFKDGEFYTLEKGEGYPPTEENNVDGLRDRTRPVETREGLRRIVILGDSVTFGHGVEAHEAYPRVLEVGAGLRKLGPTLDAQTAAIPDLEVFNIALPGWSTRQERLAYERIARKYRPTDVVLAVCLNDIAELQINLAKPPAVLLSLYKKSALVRLALGAQRREIGAVEELFDERSARVESAFRLFFEEIRTLRDQVAKDGATFHVVVFPFRFQVGFATRPPTVQRRIADFARSEGLLLHDFLHAVAGENDAADLFLDYDHFNAKGHDRVATWLGGELGLQTRADARMVDSVTDSFRRFDAELRAVGRYRAYVDALRNRVRTGLPGETDDDVLGGASQHLQLQLAVDDPSARVRFAAADVLYNLRHLNADDVPVLVRGVQHQDPRVRAFATWTLGEMGPIAKDAVPALVALAKLDGGAGKTGALTAIGKIGGDSPETIPLLLQELKHPKENRRYRAARTIGRMGPAGAPALDGLIAALKDPAQLVRLMAARAIGELGEAGKRAVPALTDVVNRDPDPEVRKEATLTLSRLPGR